MKRFWLLFAFALIIAVVNETQAGNDMSSTNTTSSADEDAYAWLEDVTGDKALDWVKARNAETVKELAQTPEFETMRGDILQVLDSDARIPVATKRGEYFYNFWRDAKNPRGLWRRTTLAEYRKPAPKWEMVLDLDALAKQENENWVWHKVECLKPEYRHCLIVLSRGGADATVVREFDLKTQTFVADGFYLPEAKSEVSWIDINTLYVATDFGPGSMTTSGYARIVKLWKRGTPLSAANIVYEGQNDDIAVGAFHYASKGFERDIVVRSRTFYTNEFYLRNKDGKLDKLQMPDDIKIPEITGDPNDPSAMLHQEWMLFEIRSPWTISGKTYSAGSLLATNLDDFIAGKRDIVLLFEPTATTSLANYKWTQHHLIINVLDDVKSRLWVLTPDKNEWKREPLQGVPAFGTVQAVAVDADESDDYFMTVTDYLTPTTLHYGVVGKAPDKVKETPAFFDASKLEISQHFVKSKDGARIPYFQVAAKGLSLDGSHPTLLYGYGGFEISLTPDYNARAGRAWLSKGGVLVVANIRGGGEYGPSWHQAGLKQNRLRVYEDFAAVAEDLVARKVTSVKHLGIQGGSNGGLLMGNMLTLYPQLFGAVVCQVPLLDMKRYSHLLAGASWMEEYGDPDKPNEWEFIRTFSPYHNVRADAHYPPVLFTTSTRDDRVHPGHARKMMAKLQNIGSNVHYYENIEGGHGGAADNKQAAYMAALAYTFLWKELQ